MSDTIKVNNFYFQLHSIKLEIIPMQRSPHEIKSDHKTTNIHGTIKRIQSSQLAIHGAQN
jgi:hypothetical protein